MKRVPVLAFIGVLIFFGTALSAPVDMGPPESMGGLRFAADVAVAPSATGGGVVRINYAIAYDALPFLRYNDGYRARYELTAILYDDRDRQVTGDSWRGSVEVATYDETNARETAAANEIEFAVEPGRYKLKVELLSIDTRAKGLVEREVVVPKMVPGKMTIGTILFMKEASEADTLGGSESNPTRIYGEEQPVAIVRVPVYGVVGTRYSIELAVRSEKGTAEKSLKDTVDQTGFLTEYVWEFSVLDLAVGSYVFEADVRPLPKGEDTEAKARFRVVTSPLSWGKDQDKMLEQISLVASRDEVETLASVPPDERGPLWDEFWKSHDPDPLTEQNEFKLEFLRRLGYANAHFSGLTEGWLTDMGRIYIQNGEPDDIESQPVGQMLNAWEIWYYYGEHTKYVFIDRQGFGEFVLYETSRI
jgi:GWxTD domain-containing protein